MNLVRFPGLGLEWNISRVAFYIGSIAIYKYAICIVLRHGDRTYFSKV